MYASRRHKHLFMILIYPPVAKPGEPPAGIAKLAGALIKHGIHPLLLDANIEGLRHMINRPPLSGASSDRWTRRALRTLTDNYDALRNWHTYSHIDRYKRAVTDLNHGIEKLCDHHATLGLANFQQGKLSPLRSADLIRAAEHPERNPFYPYFSMRIPELVDSSVSPLIGFSINYLSQALCSFAMIGFIRQNFHEITIILGGGLVTSWMNNPDWQNPFNGLVDHLINGQGEQALLTIMKISAIKETDCTPDYSSLPLNDYLAPGHILPYSASRGCYWNRCSFCPEKAEGNPYVPASAERVMQDLDTLITMTGPTIVHLLDNAISPAILKRLAVHPPGVPWYGFARISTLLTDMEFCITLKKAGCVMLKLGLESGDQGVLDRMHKGIDIETASVVLRTLKKAGIAIYVYLLFGTPPETLYEARNTLDFVVRHKDEIGFLNLALFNMPVCSQETGNYETSSFYEGDLSLYTDFRHPGGWDRRRVRDFLDKEFRKHRAVSEILRKDPPVFTSNHAPFFILNADSIHGEN